MTVHDLPTPRIRELVARLVDRSTDDEESEEIAAIAAWTCLVEPGDGIAGRLVAELGAATALRLAVSGAGDGRALDAAGIDATAWSKARGRWRPRIDADAVERALELSVRSGARLLVPHDDRWPASLGDLGDHAPLGLWVRGDLDAARRAVPAVAIVGARASTGYGEHMATELAAELAGRGVAVVSGAAYGIDGAAHRAALGAGGATIALLAGGLDRPYPAGHADLLGRIVAHGAVLSEVPCGGAPTRWRFLQRNRLIAALAGATVVVEAGARSGSLNTVSHAAQLGRPLGAVPGPVTSAASAGCHRVLREFESQCITSADDVMRLLGAEPPREDAGSSRRTDDRTRVLDALSTRARRAAEDVARRAGMAIDEVESHLGLLGLEGLVESDARGWRLVVTAGAVAGAVEAGDPSRASVPRGAATLW